MRMILSQSSLSVLRNGIGRSQPALLTSSQIGPSSTSTLETASLTEAASPTSTAYILIAAWGASFAVSSPPCGLMSKIAILQPSSASRSVSPRPIPCPPPVTTATFPDRPFNAALPCRLSFVQHFPREGGIRDRHPVLSSCGRPVLQRISALRIHLARDDRLHDLDRAARNLDHPRIRIGSGDRIFPHIAPATKQLQAFVHRFAVQFGGEHLRHRRIDRVELALHEERDALVGKDTRDSRL